MNNHVLNEYIVKSRFEKKIPLCCSIAVVFFSPSTKSLFLNFVVIIMLLMLFISADDHWWWLASIRPRLLNRHIAERMVCPCPALELASYRTY